MIDYPRVETVPAAPGFYRISNGAYHSGLGISSTRLKRALTGHAHFHTPLEDTDALLFGRAFHSALLEPASFAVEYPVMPDFSIEHGHYNSNAHKAAKAAWLAATAGAEIIKPEWRSQIDTMVGKVITHPRWSDFKGYDVEIMATTIDAETGLPLKCKFDHLGVVIVDYKTTSHKATPSSFRKAVLDYGYHVSAAFYADIAFQVTGVKHRFIHGVCEKAKPHEVAFYELDDEYIVKGRQLYRAALRRIAKWRDQESVLTYGSAIHLLRSDARLLYNTQDILADMEIA